MIGDRSYAHEFVVAPFPIKKDGIMGLDLLRVLRANIDVAAGEITLDGQKIRLPNHPLGWKKNVRQLTVCRTELHASWAATSDK